MGQHHDHNHLQLKSKKTGWVLVISIATMLLEISFGYLTNSMALLSDGWHMSSHVIAIGASWLTYKYVLKQQSINKKINPDRILSITGFINASVLAFIAIFVIVESIERFCNPVSIQYSEALVVAFIGLIVNVTSAKILHHEEEHSDHNLRATYLHILADILTSVLAIIALFGGLYFQLYKGDAVVGIIGSLVILLWSKKIIRNSYNQIFHINNSDKNDGQHHH
jgi:cation diffusion facilitator family transporter